MKNILVTDSLFIFRDHVEILEKAGFSVERLYTPQATEAELIEALQGKHGYILGGIEKVTERVIESAKDLEVITFTGADWRNFIPGHALATEKGIVITNCPGANSNAVVEYTLSLILAMTREIFDLGRTGTKTFKTTKSLKGSSVGIIGMGHIGEKVARMLKVFGVEEIYYFNRTRKEGLEKELGLLYMPMEELVQKSDIVTLHASKEIGDKYFNENLISLMKEDSLLINCSFESALDFEDLLPYLESGKIRCAHDGEITDNRFAKLQLYNWFNSNAHTAYNTHEANRVASDMAVQSIINVLGDGKYKYKVN